MFCGIFFFFFFGGGGGILEKNVPHEGIQG